MSDPNFIAAAIGPSFTSECEAAGILTLPFSYTEGGVTEAGVLLAPEFAEEDRPRVEAVIAAHDPTKPAPVPPPTSCSRLGLKRAFDELNLWGKVKAMIASDEDMQEEWDLATELKVSDPIVQKAIAGLGLIGIPMTPDQVTKLMVRANALVK